MTAKGEEIACLAILPQESQLILSIAPAAVRFLKPAALSHSSY
jgi:hypothetical protein